MARRGTWKGRSPAPPAARLYLTAIRELGRIAALGVLFTVIASSAEAQVIVGVVEEMQSAAPLPGVLVSLIAENGTPVAATLSDSVGRFVVRTDVPGRYRLRAERIGLGTSLSSWIALDDGGQRRERIVMADRAIELQGLLVDAGVQHCRLDQGQAVLIQRWWEEARKALSVASVVQRDQLVRFRLYRFQREWTADLRSLLQENGSRITAHATRPFVSLPSADLHSGGYVQSRREGRRYFAPDADVILSPEFLSSHCFSIEKGDPGRIGLRFDPTRARRIPDIAGVLWVDTTSAELDELDFRYVNLPEDIPGREAGGRIEFRYLPSGAWIVSRWWIRMPRIGVKPVGWGSSARQERVVARYVDVGGQAEELDSRVGRRDRVTEWGSVRGVVWDSLRGRALPEARVVITGTRLQSVSAEDGRFEFDRVPAGRQGVAFFHGDLARMGLPSPVTEIDIVPGGSLDIALGVPPFQRIAESLCPESRDSQATVVVGEVVDEGEVPVEGALIEARWERGGTAAGIVRESRRDLYTGTDGRFVLCDLPGDVEVEVSARTVGGARSTERLVAVAGRITTRTLRVPEL